MVSGTRPVILSSDADQDPVDPDKWKCEHCTYHNSRARKICEMCCKTSSIPPPQRNAEPPRATPVSQPATPRENQTEQFVPPHNVTNMAMQLNSQQIPHAVNEQVSRKPEPANLQAAQTGTPARPAWEGPGRAIPTVSAGPPLPSNYPGVTSPGQRAVLDHSGVVPGQRAVLDHSGVVPGQRGVLDHSGVVPGQRAVLDHSGVVPGQRGVPFSTGMPYGFPPPPPSFLEPMGMTGSVPEINSVASFPAPIGNSFLHHLSPGFPQSLPATACPASPADDTVRRQQHEIYISGARYVEWLKTAEMEGFTAEEVNIASILGIDDPEGPIHWLQNAWYDLIHRVMIQLSVPENSQEIGNISPEEVRDALIDCTGDVSRAVNKCMENRKKKVKDLQQAGVYAKTDCINALDTSVGDTEKAILALEKMAMRPILQRVLNSCLPDNATQDEVIMALTRQTNTQTPQDRANFEAIVKDLGQIWIDAFEQFWLRKMLYPGEGQKMLSS
ncbi:CD40 signaling pathway [Desmophyllum pertusum]|uniref:CD40 signaling pathway n=1 Tax=Desmophyllum pertusum TaxID=174260 RepID=A0A9W9ZNU8_9CNID|nr:CD40 signaling pathway [Desmophyllum pertusum]